MVIAAIAYAMCRLAFGGNASWEDDPYSLTIPTHFTGVGQVRSGSVGMTLDHRAPCTVQVSVANGGDEVLTCSGDTLLTQYKLTGLMLEGGGDATWVDSSTFRTKVYTIVGDGKGVVMTLWVQATSASARANNAGTYSASVILTLVF